MRRQFPTNFSRANSAGNGAIYKEQNEREIIKGHSVTYPLGEEANLSKHILRDLANHFIMYYS